MVRWRLSVSTGVATLVGYSLLFPRHNPITESAGQMSTPQRDDEAGCCGYGVCINRRYCLKGVDSCRTSHGENPAMTNIGRKIWGSGSNQLQEPHAGVTPVQNLLPRVSDTSCSYMGPSLIRVPWKDIRVRLHFRRAGTPRAFETQRPRKNYSRKPTTYPA